MEDKHILALMEEAIKRDVAVRVHAYLENRITANTIRRLFEEKFTDDTIKKQIEQKVVEYIDYYMAEIVSEENMENIIEKNSKYYRSILAEIFNEMLKRKDVRKRIKEFLDDRYFNDLDSVCVMDNITEQLFSNFNITITPKQKKTVKKR